MRAVLLRAYAWTGSLGGAPGRAGRSCARVHSERQSSEKEGSGGVPHAGILSLGGAV